MLVHSRQAAEMRINESMYFEHLQVYLFAFSVFSQVHYYYNCVPTMIKIIIIIIIITDNGCVCTKYSIVLFITVVCVSH